MTTLLVPEKVAFVPNKPLANGRIQLTRKQANVFCWGWQPEARFRYVVAGRRWGKTFLQREEIRRACRLAIERGIGVENEIWFGSPTYKQARRVFWKTLLRSIPEAWVAHVNNSDCAITLISGHVIRIVGLDNYDSLRGSGLWFFCGDEFDDTKREAWTEVIRPMLATSGGHAIFIGSPKGFHLLYEGYVKGQAGPGRDPSVMSWKYTSLEGGNIPPAEIEEAKRTLDARTFRQEYEAQFTTYSGRVYYGFSRENNVRPAPEYTAWPTLQIGMDFNINPMTATVFVEYVKDGRVYSHCIDEIIIPTSNTHEMCEEIRKRYGRPSFDPMAKLDVRHITIYPDPAGAQNRSSAQGLTDISILRREGFHVMAMSSHPLVRDRITIVNGKLRSADEVSTMLVDYKCAKLIAGLEKQTYKQGTSEPDKSGGHDHVVDSVGYYIFTRFAHSKPRLDTIVHMSR